MRPYSDGQRVVQSVARALEIMQYIGKLGGPVSLTQLGRDMGISLSTLHGILVTLKNYDFIRQDPETDKYFLGFSLVQLGNKVPESFDSKRVILHHMKELSEFYEETVHLAVLSHVEAFYLDKVEGRRTYRLTSRVGERRPLHCCAIGKAMLAYQPPDVYAEILAAMELTQATPNSITSKDVFSKQMDQVRAQGYALDNEETEIGLCGVGAPLWNHTGKVIAAISVALPAYRYNQHGGDEMGKHVREIAGRISSQLGYAEVLFDKSLF